MKLTVIICTHNPRKDYLCRTLDSLRAQTLPKEEWELLVVDNASRSPVAEAWDLSWHLNGRHIVEPELGLAAARVRGIKEALSDLLVFVDDDNVLDKSYLMLALEIAQKWPMLGVWGSGVIIPEYELEPADELKKLTHYLALRELTKACWSNVYLSGETAPCGAGLCVRATVADAYRQILNESPIFISGRRGNSLFGGEDFEIAYVACDIGLGMGVFPELRLTHLIPKERVSTKYLMRLIEESNASGALLAYKWKGVFPTSYLSPRGLLSILMNIIVRKGIDRQTYLAYVRGLISARKIIADAHAKGDDCHEPYQKKGSTSRKTTHAI